MSVEKQKAISPQTLRDHAIQSLEVADWEEMFLRARNAEHFELLQDVWAARWMQEHPQEDATHEEVEELRRNAHVSKENLQAFEANGYQYPRSSGQT